MTEFRRGARSLAYGWIVAALVVTVDQLVKMRVVTMVTEHDGAAITVFPFLRWIVVLNTGMSFGLFSGLGDFANWLFLGVAIFFSLVLSAWMMKSPVLTTRLALALMIGGAIGNAVDRVRWGGVIDFVDVSFWGWRFWTFNGADAAISVGAVLLVADSLFRKES